MDKDSSFELPDATLSTPRTTMLVTMYSSVKRSANGRKLAVTLTDHPLDKGMYTNDFRPEGPWLKQSVNYVGNNLKNLKLSTEKSPVRKPRVSYFDIFYH
ncbi:hypothetical protein C8Q72DRAFT_882912 [Fomitopsis betulina]|nr:hypothetical protein C8Q72DRAFT_882912 [Fomitopsis betulina]